jgi:cytochrome c-type biogenesis protein CcmE
MRKFFTLLLAATFVGLPLLADPTTYGKALTGKDTVKISELLASPDKYVGKTVRVEGVITDVCAKRGCWMKIGSDKEFQDLRFKVDDGVIVIPMSAKGKSAIAEGVFTKFELSAEEVKAAAKHECEEQKKEFDEKQKYESKALYLLKGTGAVIR